MMGYSMDMNEEQKPQIRQLLPEGLRKFKIIDCEEKTSKAGNLMFVISAEDVETGYVDTWYAVGEPKKRWFLKAILSACGCTGSQDGVYSWDVKDILNHYVLGLVVHEENEWINREGETIKKMQHKVVDIQETEQTEPSKDINPEEIAWDDDKPVKIPKSTI